MSQAAAQASTAPSTNGPDTDAVIAVNLSRMKVAQERYSSENGSLRSTFAKAEQQGVHLKAAKRALAVVKSGNVDAIITEEQAFFRYLKIMRHGITDAQLSLDLESNLAPLEELATLDGRSAGFDVSETATEQSNPHHLNTPTGQAWLSAFRQARVERELVLSMKDDVAQDDAVAAEDDED